VGVCAKSAVNYLRLSIKAENDNVYVAGGSTTVQVALLVGAEEH
jgi:hypothetical protein